MLLETSFCLATFSTDPGGLQTETALMLDTVSEAIPWMSGSSMYGGCGGLSALGEGVLDVDLSLFLSNGVPSSGNSVLYSGITGVG